MIYTAVNGEVRQLSELSTSVNGEVRQLSELSTSVNGEVRKIYSKEINLIESITEEEWANYFWVSYSVNSASHLEQKGTYQYIDYVKYTDGKIFLKGTATSSSTFVSKVNGMIHLPIDMTNKTEIKINYTTEKFALKYAISTNSMPLDCGDNSLQTLKFNYCIDISSYAGVNYLQISTHTVNAESNGIFYINEITIR